MNPRISKHEPQKHWRAGTECHIIRNFGRPEMIAPPSGLRIFAKDLDWCRVAPTRTQPPRAPGREAYDGSLSGDQHCTRPDETLRGAKNSDTSRHQALSTSQRPRSPRCPSRDYRAGRGCAEVGKARQTDCRLRRSPALHNRRTEEGTSKPEGDRGQTESVLW